VWPISNYTMNEDEYEMSQFVIGFDGGGSDQYEGNDEGSVDALGGDFYLSPPPPKFLLPPPPLPEFMKRKLKSTGEDCDVETSVFNLQHHLETCDINYVSFSYKYSNIVSMKI
jgi:hypothetical protein